jgi:hypothetical protein
MVKSWGIRAPSYENLAPADFGAKVMLQQFAKMTEQLPAVLVVRDYRNWLASASVLAWRRIKRVPDGTEYEQRAKVEMQREYLSGLINSWADLFREAIGETHHLEHGIPVRYEHFRADRAYRENICALLSGEYNETQLNYVPVNGGGSSFDGMQMMDCGSKMTTDRRHLEILEHPAAELYRWALEAHTTWEEKEM